MMKLILLLFFVMSSVFSGDLNMIVQNYKNSKFKKVCLYSSKKIYKIKNEDILSLIGDACLKSDYINPLGDVIKALVSTKKSRENASYFATILLQKKLIYQFMNDGIRVDDIRLPRTNYILSIVFQNIVKKNYRVLSEKPKKLEIELKGKRYIVWLKEDKPPKVVIDLYINGKLSKRHWYL